MSGSYEKSVKGGTKIKLAAPKSKYVEHILQATHAGDAGVAEVFRTLTFRLRDSTWTIVFKALIIVHLMIREGSPEATLRFIADSPSKMAISSFTDAQIQGGNIQHYHNYLLARAKAYQSTKVDWVRDGQGRLNKQTVDKGLLRETETIQKQLAQLFKCELFSHEPENEISLTAFRLLIMDLLVLFKTMNEGMINILGHYFELSKTDSERAVAIYKNFCRLTERALGYLQAAKQYEHATRLEIPVLKHAPITLLESLEEYHNDADFEFNRKQYLAHQDGKALPSRSDGPSKTTAGNATPSSAAQQTQAPKPPPADLIDFFGSIEQPPQPPPVQNGNPYQLQHQQGFQPQPQQQQVFQNQQQQQVFQNQQQQQTGFPSTNPFAQMVAEQPQAQQGPQQNFGFNQQQQPFNSGQLQSIPQSQQTPFQPQTFQNGQQQQQFSNQQQPFFTGHQQPFVPGSQPQQQQQQAPMPQQFASQQQFGQQALQTSPSGQQSTNPFRQSMMPAATGAKSSPFNNSSPFNSPPPPPQDRQSTNPFARNFNGQQTGANQSPFFSTPPTGTNNFFNQQLVQSPPPQSHSPAQPLQSTKTGTNPFARSAPASTFTSPIVPQQTGTNPFRQSAFVNQQTGMSWQSNQGTIGGLEQMPTIPVFPRPAGQPQQQQQQPWS